MSHLWSSFLFKMFRPSSDGSGPRTYQRAIAEATSPSSVYEEERYYGTHPFLHTEVICSGRRGGSLTSRPQGQKLELLFTTSVGRIRLENDRNLAHAGVLEEL